MAGEVEQIIVYPAAKIALIFLRPDAIFKVNTEGIQTPDMAWLNLA